MQFYWERQYQDMGNGANMTNYINHLHNMNKELMARLIIEKGCYNLRRKSHGLAHGY